MIWYHNIINFLGLSDISLIDNCWFWSAQNDPRQPSLSDWLCTREQPRSSQYEYYHNYCIVSTILWWQWRCLACVVFVIFFVRTWILAWWKIILSVWHRFVDDFWCGFIYNVVSCTISIYCPSFHSFFLLYSNLKSYFLAGTIDTVIITMNTLQQLQVYNIKYDQLLN